jgi:NAD-dependent DNA ligase
VPGVGFTASQLLVDAFNGSFDALWRSVLASASVREVDGEAAAADDDASSAEAAAAALGAVAGIGPTLVASLAAFASAPANVQLVESLRARLTVIDAPAAGTSTWAASLSPAEDATTQETPAEAADEAGATSAAAAARPLSGWCVL